MTIIENGTVECDACSKRHPATGHRFVGACGCGWTGDRSYRDRGTANRATGLHRSAAEKRASRAYNVEVDRLLTESRSAR